MALGSQKPGGEAELLLPGEAGFIGQLHAEGHALAQGDRLIDRRSGVFVGASLQTKEVPGKDGPGDGIAAAVAEDDAVALGGQYALPRAAIVHTNGFQPAAGDGPLPDGNGEVVAGPGEIRTALGKQVGNGPPRAVIQRRILHLEAAAGAGGGVEAKSLAGKGEIQLEGPAPGWIVKLPGGNGGLLQYLADPAGREALLIKPIDTGHGIDLLSLGYARRDCAHPYIL